MRNKKLLIQIQEQEQNSLEIEQLAKLNDGQLIEAIIEWMEDKDIDFNEFKNYVSPVLIQRLEMESIKKNVIKSKNSDQGANLHNVFFEL